MNGIMFSTVNSPPDTSGYMVLAYLVMLLMISAYVISLAVRWRRLHSQAKALLGVESKDAPASKG